MMMNFHPEGWENALKQTDIIRARIQGLKTNSDTHVPYVFLANSTINIGDTIVRKGEVVIRRPSLIVPPNNPQFLGFEFGDNQGFEQDSFVNFLLVRGITMPSMTYDNKTNSLEVFEGKLAEAISYYGNLLQRMENVKTGLITGPEENWQYSVLIFICSQIARNLDQDVRKLLEEYRNQGE